MSLVSPPEDVVPQPTIVASTPGAQLDVSLAPITRRGTCVELRDSVSIATSLIWVNGSYAAWTSTSDTA